MAIRKSPRKSSLANLAKQLETVLRSWDPASVQAQKSLLATLSKTKLDKPASVQSVHDSLLFLVAYGADREVVDLAEAGLRRLTAHVEARTRSRSGEIEFYNSGIAGSDVCSVFSLALNQWLVREFGPAATLDSDEFQSEKLMQLLNPSLNEVEQEMMHSEKMEWNWWSELMSGAKGDRHQLLKWILASLDQAGISKLKSSEYLFTSLEIFTRWRTKATDPSLSSTRVRHVPVHYHSDGILKRITLEEAIAQGEPRQVKLTLAQKRAIVNESRGALATLERETDPVTYASVAETELFDMGRGVSVALFYMDAAHKMALQSYVGYLLFKNGVPCAYGGGWVVNKEAGFGVNIFPPFRGGESANIVCQLLRLYASHFKVTAFTIDPYQIGYGNPDGIQSGSFWFYYRLGFRPLEQPLFQLAEREFAKIRSKQGYRSSEATLLKLAESTLRWNHPRQEDVPRFTPDFMGDLVSGHVGLHFGGDREKAMQFAMEKLEEKTGHRKTPWMRPILLLALASGYLERAAPFELARFADAYAWKAKSEAEYLRRVQASPDFFMSLVKAEATGRDAL